MLSVSALTSYLYCARKFYLNYALKIYEPMAFPVMFGKIKHEVVDFVNKYEKSIVMDVKESMDKEDIRRLYKRAYYAFLVNSVRKYKNDLKRLNFNPLEVFQNAWKDMAKESEARAQNVVSFVEKNKVYGEQLWEKLTPKMISEYWVESQALGLRGIVDRIEDHDGKLVPFELKTGTPPKEGVWEGHKVQISAYIMMLNETAEVREGYVEYLQEHSRRKVVVNPFVEDNIKSLIQEVNSILDSSIPPPMTDNERKCASCGLKKQCEALSQVSQ
ncbi:MAG: CRISPR-associated protein Cas4 [Candidatus Woesearchaeota archaeon]